MLIRLVNVLVDDIYLAVVLTEEIVLGLVDRAYDDLLCLRELYKFEEGDLLIKAIDLTAKRPFLLFLILNCRLLVHQPFKNLLPYLTLLIQEG